MRNHTRIVLILALGASLGPASAARALTGICSIIPTSVKRATSELFMDHPPLEKRLAALAEIAREMGRPVSL